MFPEFIDESGWSNPDDYKSINERPRPIAKRIPTGLGTEDVMEIPRIVWDALWILRTELAAKDRSYHPVAIGNRLEEILKNG